MNNNKLYIVFDKSSVYFSDKSKISSLFLKKINSEIKQVIRASYVTALNLNNKFYGYFIDFSPIGGEVLYPFDSYKEAVDEEIKIIDKLHSSGCYQISSDSFFEDYIKKGKIYSDLNSIKSIAEKDCYLWKQK